ncbi:copper transporter [Saccharomonospora piscinae]|uniref:copper transporter n=1 Tax=Saccharomonospora piscinae TaxID=687388 RepID=UPI0004642A67|nr:copper transporter [Saccharomonospora piscinae]
MRSPRWGLVPVAAVVLAFAAGLGIGATALHGSALSSLAADRDSLADRVRLVSAERDAARERVAELRRTMTEVAPSVVDGTLAGRTVVVVDTPDVAEPARTAMRDLLEAAGSTVTGEVRLTSDFTGIGQTDQLRDLATTLQPAGVRLPVGGEPGSLAGALLGSVLLLDAPSGQEQATEQERRDVLAALRHAGFLTDRPGGSADAVEPAELAVVLAGAEPGAAPTRWLSRFAEQLDRAGGGAVLAGPGSPGSPGDGEPGAGPPRVASAATPEGRLSAVLALRQRSG